MSESDLFDGLGPDPYLYFSTAAGPDSADLYGPPPSVLDVYPDGTPSATSESMLSAGGAGGAMGGILSRPDVRALVVLSVGLVALHWHMNS